MPRELKSEEELRALIKQRVLASTGYHMPPPIRIVRTDLPGNDWNWMVLDPPHDRQVRWAPSISCVASTTWICRARRRVTVAPRQVVRQRLAGRSLLFGTHRQEASRPSYRLQQDSTGGASEQAWRPAAQRVHVAQSLSRSQ